MGVVKHSWTSWPRPQPLCPYEAFSKVGDYEYGLSQWECLQPLVLHNMVEDMVVQSRVHYYMYHTSDDTSHAYRLLSTARSRLQQSDSYWRITKNPYVTESYVTSFVSGCSCVTLASYPGPFPCECMENCLGTRLV